MLDYLARRAGLIAESQPGLVAARRLAELTDDAVRDLSQAASSRFDGRWALVALGGWGSGALLPSSDLDILVLSDSPAEKLRPFVEAVLYPLWDAGLKVGHQVRSPKEQLRAMKDDLASCTAALTGRPLAGDVAWAERVLADGAALAHRRRRALLGKVAERPRPGSPFALEPDLKEDAGGRRDYDELVWSAAIVAGVPAHDPDGLVAAGLATTQEIADAQDAAETVIAARFELARLGLGTRMTLDAAESLTACSPEDVQRALARTAALTTRVRRRVAGRDERRTPLDADALFALLDLGAPALSSLEELAVSGALDAFIPGFGELMATRRPGIGHDLTVGAHSLKTAALVLQPDPDPALLRSLEALEHPRALQVAALAHDAGKRLPGPGHPERGVASARAAARALGLPAVAADHAADLVRLHLSLVETATRIDLDDEDAILRAAASIGSRELVAPLHLLTAADSRATGPSTWTRWTSALVASLVSRLDAALSDDVDGAGIATRGESVRAAALASISADREAQRGFISRAPLRYLASRGPGEIARDAELVASLLASSSAEHALVAVGAGPAPETHAVTVVARNRPELLARIAGAMSLAGLDIHSLDAYGAPGNIALDAFVVSSATRRPVTTETFAAFERYLRAALLDRLELRTRLAERRRHYPPRAREALRAEIISAGWDTAVRVSAPDRPGLLHDLALAVSSTGLDIRWAKVMTVEGVAFDTFHITGADGGPVDDPGELGHLSMRLREIR